MEQEIWLANGLLILVACNASQNKKKIEEKKGTKRIHGYKIGYWVNSAFLALAGRPYWLILIDFAFKGKVTNFKWTAIESTSI